MTWMLAASTAEEFESIVLEIDGSTFAFTLTRIDIQGDFLITPNTLTVTEHNGPINTWQAAFSHDGNTFTLIEFDSSTLIYHRR